MLVEPKVLQPLLRTRPVHRAEFLVYLSVVAASRRRRDSRLNSAESTGTHLIHDMRNPHLIFRRPEAELLAPSRALEPPSP